MTIRTRLVLWYSGILLVGLLLVAGWAYYEMAVEHPGVSNALAKDGDTPLEEFGEVILFGGLPAMVLALVGGWLLMRRALLPVTILTQAVEQVQAETLSKRLPRTRNGDELDRLTEVFNSMMERLENSFASVREFTLHASHELKTPLTVMRNGIETALREDRVTPDQRELLSNQLQEIERLTRIVNSLAFLAKADAGQAALRLEPVRLDELVKDSFADAQMLAQPQEIAVTMAACEEIIVQGDRHRLRQLLLNLTDNAIKYNQPQGSVTIALSRKNGAAELKISNTGACIAPDKLPRVFDRFYRGDPAHNNEVEGSGLGLSIAQWIVHAHGGKIAIVSEPADLTSVTVQLPV